MKKYNKKRVIHHKKKLMLLLLLLLLLGLSIHFMIRFGLRIHELEHMINTLQAQLAQAHAHAVDLQNQLFAQTHTVAQLQAQLAKEHALNQALQQKLANIQPTNTGYVAKFHNIPVPHQAPQAIQHVAEAGALAGIIVGAGKLLANLWEAVAPIL